MAAAHLETARNAVSAPVLRVRRQLDRVAVRAARGRHRVRALSGPEQSGDYSAAPAVGPGPAHAKVSANVRVLPWQVTLHQTTVIRSIAGTFSASIRNYTILRWRIMKSLPVRSCPRGMRSRLRRREAHNLRIGCSLSKGRLKLHLPQILARNYQVIKAILIFFFNF